MHPDEVKLTNYALGEFGPAEQVEVEEHLRECAVCRQAVEGTRKLGGLLSEHLANERCPERTVCLEQATSTLALPVRRRPLGAFGWAGVSVAAALLLIIGLIIPAVQSARENGTRLAQARGGAEVKLDRGSRLGGQADKGQQVNESSILPAPTWQSNDVQYFPPGTELKLSREAPAIQAAKREAAEQGQSSGVAPVSPGFAPGMVPAPVAQPATGTNFGGRGQGMRQVLPAVSVGGQIDGMGRASGGMGGGMGGMGDFAAAYSPPLLPGAAGEVGRNTEAYGQITDNPFREVHDHPLSTFSIDVDTASYSNVRRFLSGGAWPPKDAVRIEELLDYFAYDYAPPQDDRPFAAHVEVADCPWDLTHRLVRVALKGREVPEKDRPLSNLVFLLDVSGSMQPANKLPLVKQALQMLVKRLGENDRVAIVVYAGASGLVLPSTTCDQKDSILGSLDRLQAGGSTNGASGIQLAYDVAQKNFITGATNRVILCTDGDFNVGITDQGALTRLIEEKAAGGTFLSVLGFGMGNLKDSTLEKLADRGNGNYGYIDTLKEAKKLFVDQMSGTLVTIAKDVKIQIEFNPAQVAGYRLIGYENRIFAAKDFNDDKKDAGEIGAGHTVTALYEIVPAGQPLGTPTIDPLKYQQQPAKPTVVAAGNASGELLTLKLRYKEPAGQVSKLLEYPITDTGHKLAESSQDFRFAAAVAEFGMLLRASPYKGSTTMDGVLELAEAGQGADAEGYRAEFIKLVGRAKQLRQ